MTAQLEGGSRASPPRSNRDKAPPLARGLPAPGRPFHHDKASVAQLTVREITRMTEGELARVVREVEPCPNAQPHLGCCDRATLERLVYLARQVCRRQGY